MENQIVVPLIEQAWFIYCFGLLGVLLHMVTKPQSDDLSVVMSWIKKQWFSAVVSTVIYSILYVLWIGGYFVSWGLGDKPNVMAVFMGYSSKSVWEHFRSIMSGKIGLKTNGNGEKKDDKKSG